MTRRLLSAWVALAGVLAGCSGPSPRTEVITTIDGDSTVRGAAGVRVTVLGGSSPGTLAEVDQRSFPSPLAWPITVGVTPQGGDASRVFQVFASAADSSGMVIARGRVTSGFVAGETRWAHIELDSACPASVTCVGTETCCGGTCVDGRLDASSLPTWQGDGTPPARAQVCTGVQLTAGGVDAGTTDGGATDAGSVDAGPMDAAPVDAGVDMPLQVAAGGSHSCVLYTSGRIFCWGDNARGELGDGTTVQRTTAVEVTGLTGPATAIVAGEQHTCALLSDHTVACWGGNANYQLGDGTTGTLSDTPIAVVGLSEGAIAIGAGAAHTCVVTTAHEVRCWGDDNVGQLGDGSTTNANTPVAGTGITNATAVAAGAAYSCALESTGGVECWGHGANGEIGDGTATNRPAPTPVSGLTNIVALSGGYGHACAADMAGALWCWGFNGAGEIGDNTTAQADTPVQVHGPMNMGTFSGVDEVAAGGSLWFLQEHTCAHTTDGSTYCWGSGAVGQLGNGSMVPKHVPTAVAGLADATSIATGADHSCAIAGGVVWCWGRNELGRARQCDHQQPVGARPGDGPALIARGASLSPLTGWGIVSTGA